MFGLIGLPELFVVVVIVLVTFGLRSLPRLCRVMGRMFAELRRSTTNDIRNTFEKEIASAKPRPTTPAPVEDDARRTAASQG